MKNIIEINGRSYDAQTGKLLATNPASLESNNTKSIPSNAPNPLHNGVVLDGVSRRKSFKKRPQHTQTAPKSTQIVKNPSATKLPSDTVGPARQMDRTKTLLRNIVKKPFGSSMVTIPIQNNQHEELITKGNLAKRTPAERVNRAKQTMRSINIARFNNINRQKPHLSTDLNVAKEPNNSNVVPVSAPTIVTKAGHTTVKQQVFNHPIVHANNHLLKKLPKDKMYKRVARALNVGTKTMAVTTSILAVLVFGSFLAYQKIPSVAMRVAANRAGFSGHLPSTIPAGFSFKGPITYTKGSIALKYKSNSDSRKFAIVQKPTEWSSESLLTNYLVNTKLQYQTYHDSGLTVYVFNGGEATWVDKGVWYSIKGEGTLSFDQILSIASSM